MMKSKISKAPITLSSSCRENATSGMILWRSCSRRKPLLLSPTWLHPTSYTLSSWCRLRSHAWTAPAIRWQLISSDDWVSASFWDTVTGNHGQYGQNILSDLKLVCKRFPALSRSCSCFKGKLWCSVIDRCLSQLERMCLPSAHPSQTLLCSGRWEVLCLLCEWCDREFNALIMCACGAFRVQNSESFSWPNSSMPSWPATRVIASPV